MVNTLVSIIIPVYNRSHLIGETLESIIKQTYKNWECIVVDDGSTDAIEELMEFYTVKDDRIKFFIRPNSLIKGANSSRNFGLKKSTGKYIQWFDSDDLMDVDSIRLKIENLLNFNCDLIISKLVNFLPDGSYQTQFYNREKATINFEDYLFRRINWMTPDPLILRDVIERYRISFNEKMKSDQEYNYYSKLLSHNINAHYLDEVLTFRRIHNNSTQGRIDRATKTFHLELFENRYFTFLDLESNIEAVIRKEFLNQLMTIYYSLAGRRVISKHSFEFCKIILKSKGILKLMVFLISVFTNYFIKKGHYFLQYSKR